MSPMEVGTTAARAEQVLNAAKELYAKNPHWVTFYREVLGLRGIVRRFFPTPEAMAEFERTSAYDEIQRMLSKLRQRNEAMSHEEPVRVITVRLPKSLHEALRREAHEHNTTMNKLCISKLLQAIDDELIPPDYRG